VNRHEPDRNRFRFQPVRLEFRANPCPHYSALLEGPPRLMNLFAPAALVARYDEVMAVLRSAEFSAERDHVPDWRSDDFVNRHGKNGNRGFSVLPSSRADAGLASRGHRAGEV
jgi:hypothetical protein